MKDIIFKVKDNRLHIVVDKSLSNKQFLEKFKQRIEKIFVLKEEFVKESILEINHLHLNNREILQLFDILNDNGVFCLGKVVCKNEYKDSLIIYKGCLRSGQKRFFKNSVLIVGSINQGSKVIVNGDLYVLGKIMGDIELKDSGSKIYCESIERSLVKITDVYKLYSEKLNDKVIYLKDGIIKDKDYKKGEIDSVKSYSGYLG